MRSPIGRLLRHCNVGALLVAIDIVVFVLDGHPAAWVVYAPLAERSLIEPLILRPQHAFGSVQVFIGCLVVSGLVG